MIDFRRSQSGLLGKISY